MNLEKQIYVQHFTNERMCAYLIGAFSCLQYRTFPVEPEQQKIEFMSPEDYLAINSVLKRWHEGYENEDIESYMSAYWSEGFRFVGDMGTEADKTDDTEFDDIREERDAANQVFSQFQDIIIEFTSLPEISIDMEETRAEVRNHYRIQGSVAAGELFQAEFTGWFAEGDNLFIFEKRDGEWLIVEWHDEAYKAEDILIDIEQLLPIVWSTLKQ